MNTTIINESDCDFEFFRTNIQCVNEDGNGVRATLKGTNIFSISSHFNGRYYNKRNAIKLLNDTVNFKQTL